MNGERKWLRNLYQNLLMLSKKKNIKIGELEKAVGVSPGYFARTFKDERICSIGSNTLIRTALNLGVSIDWLVLTNWREERVKELEKEIDTYEAEINELKKEMADNAK